MHAPRNPNPSLSTQHPARLPLEAALHQTLCRHRAPWAHHQMHHQAPQAALNPMVGAAHAPQEARQRHKP